MNLTPVFLTPEDVLVFQAFQKHYTLIGLLDSLDVFGIRNGSVTIHFDTNGKIGSVDKHQHYRPKDVV